MSHSTRRQYKYAAMTDWNFDYETLITQCDISFSFEGSAVSDDSGSFAPFFPPLPFISSLIHGHPSLPCLDIDIPNIFSEPSFRGFDKFGRIENFRSSSAFFIIRSNKPLKSHFLHAPTGIYACSRINLPPITEDCFRVTIAPMAAQASWRLVP